jgi:hypothetical protein
MMKRGLLCLLVFLGIFSFSSTWGEVKVFEQEIEEAVSRGQSQEQVEAFALQKAKRLDVEVADLKREIANLKSRLDYQYHENTKNLTTAYAQQRTLTKAKMPLLPAPKDAFESIAEYHKRIENYGQQVKKAEAENDAALENLKKEETLKLAQVQEAYLGQQIRVLEPFVKRLRDLYLAMKKTREFVPDPSGLSEIEQFDKLKQEEAKVKAVSSKIAKIRTSKELGTDGRFISYDDGTVLETRTNLFWAAKDSGKLIMTWQGAKSYCENYRGGGYTNWRMPTSDELAGLYDKNKHNRYDARVTDLIGITYMWVWASETRGSNAAVFGFRYGTQFWYPQSNNASHALPVRSVE